MSATRESRSWSFALHKDGNAPDEYEDAVAGDPNAGRFAMADGASESSFASLWAKLLVEGFVATTTQVTREWLVPLRQRWAEAVDQLELDWFGEEKRDRGAFATFLGLEVNEARSEEGDWRAVAVGDCCLFQVRDANLMAMFPVESSAEFGNRPALIGSRGGGERDGLMRAKHTVGRWQKGDRVLLMTDALAEWFARWHEQRREPWDRLLDKAAESTVAFRTYIEQLRVEKELKNDDVTLLVIDL